MKILIKYYVDLIPVLGRCFFWGFLSGLGDDKKAAQAAFGFWRMGPVTICTLPLKIIRRIFYGNSGKNMGKVIIVAINRNTVNNAPTRA